mgnify:CR=1 FL=1
MTDILPFLKSLISTSGLSGHEKPVAKIIEEKWRTLVDETSLSRVGSLHGLKRGTAPAKGQRPAVMIATHMDAIGMMVSKVDGGFLHLTNLGGIDILINSAGVKPLASDSHGRWSENPPYGFWMNPKYSCPKSYRLKCYCK